MAKLLTLMWPSYWPWNGQMWRSYWPYSMHIYIYIYRQSAPDGALKLAFYTIFYSIKWQKCRLKNVPSHFSPSFVGIFGQIRPLEAATLQKFPVFSSIFWNAYFYSVSGSLSQNSWAFWTPFRDWNAEMLENIGEPGKCSENRPKTLENTMRILTCAQKP